MAKTKTLEHGSILLKEARVKKKLTQIQAAELVGVSQGDISKYESRKQVPSIDIIGRIERVFGTPMRAWMN